ncbi:MAG: hypothetical protein ACM3US_07795 [Sphingomonadaceae bacterium]
MAETWDRERVIEALKEGTLSDLESGYVDPLLSELRSVARRFGLLAEGCRESGNPELQGMAQTLDLASGLLDDLLEEALEPSLRRAVEEQTWAQPRTLGEEEGL